MAYTRWLVNKRRNHNIAYTVPYKRCSEIILYSSHVSGGARSAINLCHASCQRRKTTEYTIGSLAHKNHNILVITTCGRPCISDSVYGTCRQTHGIQVSNSVYALAESVSPRTIDGYTCSLRCACTGGDGRASHKATCGKI